MAFLGMDTDQVEGHAQRILTGEQRMQVLAEELAAAVTRSVEQWRGPDAASFRATWETTSVDIRSVAQDLVARSTELTQHREAQTAASQADGTSGAPGGPGGPSQADGPVDKTNGSGEDPYYGQVDPEVAERWEKLSPEDREAVARVIIEEQLERYGIDGVPVDFELTSANGQWSFSTENGHRIEINGDGLAAPRLLHTLAHEARHAAQWEAVQATEPDGWDWLPFRDSTEDDYERLEEEHGFTREEIDSWREHWNTPVDERAPYLDQSVEVDARNAGAEYSDEITPEDLDRYEEEAGVG